MINDLLSDRRIVNLLWVAVGLFFSYNLLTLLPSLRAKYLVSPQGWGHTVGVVRSSRVSGRKSSWWVQPNYSYTVAGKSYEGTRYQFDPMKSRERAQTASRSLGSRTMVYYEKNNPASSMLVSPSELSPLSQCVDIFIAMLASVGLTLYGRLRNRN